MRFLTCLAGVTLLLSHPSVGLADTAKRVQAHLKQHKLPQRVLKRQVGNRMVKTVFFPVLKEGPKDEQALLDAMVGAERGTALLYAREPRRGTAEPWDHYVRLATSPERVYASKYDNFSMGDPVGPKAEGERARKALKWDLNSRYLLMEVGEQAVRGMDKFMDTFHGWNMKKPRDNHYSYGEDAKNYLAVRGDKAGDTSADCMWWLTNLEYNPEGKPGHPGNFLHLFGVRLTKGPQEIPTLLMHAANEKMVYVGVGVHSEEGFKAMSDAELLGREPQKGGAVGAIRPKPDAQ